MNEITKIIVEVAYYMKGGTGLLKALNEVMMAHALNRRVVIGYRFSLRLCAFA